MKKNYLVFDVGGTNIKWAIFGSNGELRHRDVLKTPDNYKNFVKVIQKIINENNDNIKGIAFSVPGRICQDENKIYGGGALTYNHGKIINEMFDFSEMMFAIENDAKVACLAEMWLGELTETCDAAVLVLGTGIGGGIQLNGKLHRGSNFSAGELSILVGENQSDPNNFSGIRVSAVDLIKRINEKLQHYPLDDGIYAFEFINKMDSRIYHLFEEYCEELARIIFNLHATLDLQKIALGGGICTQDIVIKTVNDKFLKIFEQYPLIENTVCKIPIVKTHFGADANLYGALYNLFLKYDIFH